MTRQLSYLITGAAHGIGRHLTRTLISRGHRVYLIDNSASELNHTLTLLSRLARTAPPLTNASTPLFNDAKPVDLADLAQLTAAVEDAKRFLHGRLDVLVNNAMALPHTWPVEGGCAEGDTEAVVRHWERQVAVGLSAPFHLSRLCAGMMRRGEGREGGCVVNISSTRASMAEEGHEGYSAVKAGLLGLGQSLAVSFGPRYGIRVNSLVLGWVNVEGEGREGDENGWTWEEGLTVQDHDWHPAGRVGKGDDVVKAVEYLVDSDWVTGTEMVLDGGVTRKMVYPE
ncbi:Carbonyl reductase family member 4 [Sphaceloma murrayae]|uniref:Carbonyl reductase family member 4 n=1 Tax=Sphaceloma murrayae TaxID=2082308 RepID=A0A2K1QUX8_9PEZI|nr:Carbonyl reductase family member 4 [Sphaceloma murrayae]